MPDLIDPHDAWSIVRRVVARFESAWRRGERPAIDDYISEAAPLLELTVLRDSLTVDLVFAELEFRLKAGETVRVEEYLTCYREALTSTPDTLVELIVTEWTIRARVAGKPPDDAEYQERFPRGYAAFLEFRKRRSVAPTGAWPPGRQPAVAPGVTEHQRPLPSRFGRFELQEMVGRGSFGIVYRAWDTVTRRDVAVKIPRASLLASSEDAKTFLREARIASELNHPNIVRLLEGAINADEKTPYLVSDFIEGRTLADALKIGLLPFATSAHLMATIADALQYAHERSRQVIHRDLKPGNILLDKLDRPHLTDFGLAQRESGDSSSIMLPKDSLVGTYEYMSPEQVGGYEKLGPASDIFSAGIILYEMLTGELPFRGRGRMLLARITDDEPPAPRSLNQQIPPALEAICLKALRKHPGDRHASARELRDELLAYLDGDPFPVARTSPVSRFASVWGQVRKRPIRSLVIAYCFLAGTLGIPLLLLAWFFQGSSHPALPGLGVPKTIKTSGELSRHEVLSQDNK